MPELPEVETIKRDLARQIVGKTIQQFQIIDPQVSAPQSPRKVVAKIQGRKVAAISRRAKILIWDLEKIFLVFHLKMTGQIIFQPAQQKNQPVTLPNHSTRAVITFTDGSKIFFNDWRKFGWLKNYSATELKYLLNPLGPEPLTKQFSLQYLQQQIKRFSRRKIKQLLMDQKIIAGVGNIYADETCFAARVDPQRQMGTLTEQEIKTIWQKLKLILRAAITQGGTSSNTYRRLSGARGSFQFQLKVYGRGNKTCQRCQQKISKIKLGGRGTHWCPNCQK